MKPLPFAITVFLSFGLIVSFLMEGDEDISKPIDDSAKKIVKSQNHPNTKSSVNKALLGDSNFKNSVKGVATSFAQQSRFPSTSMPIENEVVLQKYIPNQPVGASLPFENEQGEVVRFGLKTDKYRYFLGDVIDMRVFVTGDVDYEGAQLNVYLVGNKNILHSLDPTQLSKGATALQVNTGELNTGSWPDEIQVQAVLDLSGERLQVIETIRLDESIATVETVKDSFVEGDSLIIPVEIDTEEKGYFRLTAVLYSKGTDKPLVHLEGKAKLSINNDIIKLKAQYQSLQVSQDEGPYLLRNLWIEKMPSAPDYQAKFGGTNNSEYVIDKHRFEEYSDSDYVNNQAQLSLQFLQKIGGINQTKNE